MPLYEYSGTQMEPGIQDAAVNVKQHLPQITWTAEEILETLVQL